MLEIMLLSPLSLPHGSFCFPSLEDFSDVCIIPFIGRLVPRLGFGFFSRLWEPHRLLMWFGSLMQWFRTLLLGCREGGGGRGRRCGSC